MIKSKLSFSMFAAVALIISSLALTTSLNIQKADALPLCLYEGDTYYGVAHPEYPGGCYVFDHGIPHYRGAVVECVFSAPYSSTCTEMWCNLEDPACGMQIPE